ncbi:ABC transporter substrate-binding protein [Bifidobacterium lemurum]|nr:ABC transporter substrate-binding protein [Bifidobacterium lemurum]
MGVPALAACGSSAAIDESKGKVYYLNFKPEAADQWTAIAETYTEQTGVQVTVETAASGTYEQTLKSEMAKDEAPTLFQVNGPVGYARWKDYTEDMSGTAVYEQMEDQSSALMDGDKVVGVPYVLESYGIIYNKDLLQQYFDLGVSSITSVDEIDSFDALKTVADGIQEHKDELGVQGAFASSGFDSSSDWRFKSQLAGVPLYWEFKEDGVTEQPATIKGTYLENFKDIFDLYITDSTTEPTQLSSKTGDDANSEFALGDAVFYQNGTWAWTDLSNAGVEADSVGMLPIYIGADGEENAGLTTGSENYWCINSQASDLDKQATEDFLEWMITSDEGKDALAVQMGFSTPFKTFSDVTTENPLIDEYKAGLEAGKESMSWTYTMIPSEQWKNDLGSALLEYAQGTGTWEAVETAFVDGWASEYAAAE